MRRGIVVLFAFSVLAPAGPAGAGHAKNCGVILDVTGDRDYRVRANGVSCDFARTWSRRYIRRGRRPSGWSCNKPGGNISFYCKRGGKYYYAQRA
jgi:hypothetical protein